MTQQTTEDELEIYERIVEGTDYSKDLTIETEHGEMTFTVTPLSRTQRWDHMSKMPDGMFQSEGDGDDAEFQASSIPDGEATQAFEDMITESMAHPRLSPSELELLVREFTDETLFEVAMEILDFSSDTGKVSGFRLE